MCIISQCCNDGGRRNCNRSVPYQHIRCSDYTIIQILKTFVNRGPGLCFGAQQGRHCCRWRLRNPCQGGGNLKITFLISGVKVWESKAKLAAVIQYEGDDLTAGVLSWASLLKLGDSLPDSELMIEMMVMMAP